MLHIDQNTQADSLVPILLGDAQLIEQVLYLQIAEMVFAVRSNNRSLMAALRDYFEHIVVANVEGKSVTLEIIAIEGPEIELDISWHDWAREPGKIGKKDAYFDLADGRLVRKVRTGMTFLQSTKHYIASGPCVANSNQVINFINAQYMSILQQHNWLICHAAAVAFGQKAIAISGFSGGGKSTMMLHLMADSRFKFVSNDRLFIKADTTGGTALVESRGIPKLPRVNPGTVVNNPQLRSILSAEEAAQFEAMDTAELWDIEQKYDVMINDIYGDNRFEAAPILAHFIVLNWSRASDEATQITSVDIAERSALLDAIMKSPGPFYQYADGRFYQDHTPLIRQGYIDLLSKVNVIEVSGRVDFDALQRYCLQELV